MSLSLSEIPCQQTLKLPNFQYDALCENDRLHYLLSQVHLVFTILATTSQTRPLDDNRRAICLIT